MLYATKSAIEISDLSVSYSAVVNAKASEKTSFLNRSTKKFKIDALDNINVNFQSGKVTGLVGGNGAGKSTLLKRKIPPSNKIRTKLNFKIKLTTFLLELVFLVNCI